MSRFLKLVIQKLIAEKKLKNYLLYASGEILLLVIGIFIALQINNWNSQRKDSDREKQYLENIRRDLNEQLTDINKQTDFESAQLFHIRTILNVLDRSLPFTDSLSGQLTSLTGRRTFVPVDPTFQDLKSTGNLNLIKNYALRDKLIKYHQSLTYVSSVISKNNETFVDELFVHSLIKNSLLNSTRVQSFIYPLELEELQVSDNTLVQIDMVVRENMKDIENKIFIINLLSNRYLISSIHKIQMENLKKETIILLDEIESEIR